MSPLIQLPDFLSQAEARQQIQFSEQLGYQTALIRTVSGQQHLPAIRQNQRLELANPVLSQQLFHRLQQRTRTIAHAQVLNDAVAIYPLWRYYRYLPGDHFKWHRDGIVRDSQGRCSRFTLLIYLNSDYQGGATQFREASILPRTGMALLFPHQLLHQGERLRVGCKYVLRSDILFTAEQMQVC